MLFCVMLGAWQEGYWFLFAEIFYQAIFKQQSPYSVLSEKCE